MNVTFPTWTTENGQDELKWEAGAYDKINDRWEYTVYVGDHNCENGIYRTNIYANDSSNSVGIGGIDVTVDRKPSISFEQSDVTAETYKVYANQISMGAKKLQRVAFPTWSENNGQDDLVGNWENMSLGTYDRENDRWVYTVAVADHNYDSGKYFTHVYAFDESNNKVGIGATEVNVSVTRPAPTPTPTPTPGWQWPVEQYGTEYPFNYKSTLGKGFHLATDIQYSTKNLKIVAACSGKVILAKMNSDDNTNGNHVIIQSTAWDSSKNENKTVYSLYSHLDSYDVSTGMDVVKGEKIGIMGKTGTDNIHLHFSIFDSYFSDEPYGWTNSMIKKGWSMNSNGWNKTIFYGYNPISKKNETVTFYNPELIIDSNGVLPE